MNRRRLVLIAGSAVAAAIVAAVAVWWFVLRSDAPAPVSIEEAAEVVTGETADASSPSTTTGPTSSATDVEGSWAVVTGNGSFAGYRVEEELARIGFTTAAGRTEELTAEMIIEGETVTEVSVVVDMQTLESDDDRRDRALRSQSLETDDFPTASFRSTSPIDLPPDATSGEPFQITVEGLLELHGVANEIELELEAQLVDGTIAVVGSAQILFADHAIEPPSAPILLGVDDEGEMEFQLLFERS